MIYLSHSFDRKSEIRMREMGWRRAFGLHIFNPLFDGNYNFDNRKDVPEDVVPYDISKIEECNVLIALIGKDITIGTTMEIVYARIKRKTVHVVAIEGNLSYLLSHAWIRYHADYVWGLDTFEHLLEHGYRVE